LLRVCDFWQEKATYGINVTQVY
jgi:hypothetical protein